MFNKEIQKLGIDFLKEALKYKLDRTEMYQYQRYICKFAIDLTSEKIKSNISNNNQNYYMYNYPYNNTLNNFILFQN